MKISTADKYFSLCIRESNNWTCERCGKEYLERSRGLHCSHIYSRTHRTIRWCKDNAQALCFYCHDWYGNNPADSGLWIAEILGEGHIQLLREKRDSRIKVSKLEEKEIGKYYKGEYERMLSQRGMGYKRVTFVSYQ